MSSRDGREQWAGYLPVEVIQAVREHEDPMWKVLADAARLYLGIEEDSMAAGYERRLDDLREEREQVKEDMNRLQSRLDDLDDTIEDVESRYEEFLEKQSSYEEHLDDILETIASTGTTVYAHKSKLTEAAKIEYGKTSSSARQDVIDDLRARRTERGLGLDDSHFTEGPVAARSAGPSAADGGNETPQFKHLEGANDDD